MLAKLSFDCTFIGWMHVIHFITYSTRGGGGLCINQNINILLWIGVGIYIGRMHDLKSTDLVFALCVISLNYTCSLMIMFLKLVYT
jgi:hypothetical protein